MTLFELDGTFLGFIRDFLAIVGAGTCLAVFLGCAFYPPHRILGRIPPPPRPPSFEEFMEGERRYQLKKSLREDVNK